MFENTGGSEGYLKHLEAAQSTIENAPQIDKNEDGLIYDTVSITIKADEPAKDHFTIVVRTQNSSGLLGAPVFEGTGYGYAPGAIDATFEGSLALKAPPAWNGLIGAKDVTFKWVKSAPLEDLIEWEVCIGDKPVMNFGGIVKGEASLVGKGGIMSW